MHKAGTGSPAARPGHNNTGGRNAMDERDTTRRTLLRAGGIGLGALAAAEMVPAVSSAAAAEDNLWTHEYWAKKGAVSLYMYRKRRGATAAQKPLPVLVLVHGSSLSGRTSM